MLGLLDGEEVQTLVKFVHLRAVSLFFSASPLERVGAGRVRDQLRETRAWRYEVARYDYPSFSDRFVCFLGASNHE